MTPLDRLRALHAAATPGPWECEGIGGVRMDGSHDGYRIGGPHNGECYEDVARTGVRSNKKRENMLSIAATHNALPSLLACVDALRSLCPDHPALAPLVKEEEPNA